MSGGADLKICKDHWQLMRDAIDSRGMSGLVAASSEAIVDNEVRQLKEAQATGEVSEKTASETFDPLMSMHWHFMNDALRCGGMYLMRQNEDGSNEGHFCPICEFVKHADGFKAEVTIDGIADQMRDWCIAEGKIARPS